MEPKIDISAYVHPKAFVCGNVTIGKKVFVAPFASVRADEGTPFYIGDFSNVQDGVVLHALETSHGDGTPVDKNLVEMNGIKFAIYIGSNVSLAHQSQVHGPALIKDGAFIGMQAFIFKSTIGKNCVIEPGAKVIGVNVPDNRYVIAGTVLNIQSIADRLPVIDDDYPLKNLNDGVVEVNCNLSSAYKNPDTKQSQ